MNGDALDRIEMARGLAVKQVQVEVNGDAFPREGGRLFTLEAVKHCYEVKDLEHGRVC